jgi:hypothetical protein
MSTDWIIFCAIVFFGLFIIERLNVIAARLRSIHSIVDVWANRSLGERVGTEYQ